MQLLKRGSGLFKRDKTPNDDDKKEKKDESPAGGRKSASMLTVPGAIAAPKILGNTQVRPLYFKRIYF